MAVGAYLLHTWVIQQSLVDLHAWAMQPPQLEFFALLVVLEAFLFINLDMYSLVTPKKLWVANLLRIIRWFPGVTLLVAMLYAEVQAYYQYSMDYKLLAIYFSIGVALVVLWVPLLLKLLLNDRCLRIELNYIISLGQVLAAMAITVLAQKIVYAAKYVSQPIMPLLVVTGLVLVVAFLGWVKFKYRKI